MGSSRDEVSDRIAIADASYRPFAPLRSWGVVFDEILWDDAKALLDEERNQASASSLAAGVRLTLREAAITTGAVEGLSHADRGISYGVAAQLGNWQAEIAAEGSHVRELFEAQLAALDLVVELATRDMPITEAWIRRLHEEICRAQATYEVRTPVGVQHHPLVKGTYKSHPNHVQLIDGTTHAYCPVALTAPEMHRLVTELAGADFVAAHPVVQAAYAHHALVSVHPFADGNGRVSRALASVFTYRAGSIPVVVHADQRPEYFDALASADRGEVDSFVGFVLRAAVDTMQRLTLALREARQRYPGETVREIAELYEASTGKPDREVEAAASRIAALLRDEVQRQLKAVSATELLSTRVQLAKAWFPPSDPEKWRHPVDRESSILIDAQTVSPAGAHVEQRLSIVVAVDAGSTVAVIRIENEYGDDVIPIRRDHLPRLSTPWFRRTLEAWVTIQVGQLLQELKRRAAATLRTSRG